MKRFKLFILSLIFVGAAAVSNAQNENALHFDGVNDRVDLPAKIHDSISGVGTIEAWIKTTNAGTSFRGIVVREFHYGIFLDNNQLMSYNWTGNGNSGATTYTGATLNDNQWHHVALTFQTGVTNGSQLYLDGVPVGGPFTHFENVQAANFRIGTNGLVGQFFQGSIDQVKIYGRALSAAEISDSYNCNTVSTLKLNAFYNFNQGVAGALNTAVTSLNDLSGQDNDGFLVNMALNGSTSNWVSGWTCAATPCPEPFALTTQTFCNAATIADLTATGTSLQWYNVPTGGTALAGATALSNATTYYVSQTVGGCESDRTPVLVEINPIPAAPTGAATQTFCNNVLVSNIQATGSNILWYTIPTGGTALIPSATITVGSTYYASQTINGCESTNRLAVTVEGCQNALNLDGVNDNVNIPSTTLGNFVTLEAWIKTPNAGTGFRGVVVQEFKYGIFLNNNQLMTYNWTASGNPGANTYTGVTLNDNQWHHVAVTFEAGVTGGTQMYIDGQAVGAPLTHFLNGNSPTFRIGSNNNSDFFAGNIDNVKVWTRKLSAAEINETYNCGVVAATNLVRSYNFNQGIAGQNNIGLTSLTDLSGNNFNGALSNFALTGSTSNWVEGFACATTPCPAPFGSSVQYFCNTGTVGDLTATGTDIQWYTTPTGGSPLSLGTALLSGVNTYYASQTVNGCESAIRYATDVYLTTTPSAPTGSSVQIICNGGANTLANLSVTGSNIIWYDSPTGGSVLSINTPTVFGSTYYASQTINTCESSARLAVTVTDCQNALHFDGTNDVVNTNIGNIGGAGTLETWIKTSNAGTGFRGLIVREFYYGLFLNNNQLMTYNWTGSGTVGATTYTGATLNDNEWHHVAVTFQTGVTGGTQLYLDGQPVGPPITLFTTSNSSTFKIGNNGTQPSYYQGLMDNVSIWGRVLSPGEINDTYNCSSPANTNLVASYNFNQGNAGAFNGGMTTLIDGSGNNRNGSLSAFALNGATSNWVEGLNCLSLACPAPTGNTSQSFCQSGTIADLVAVGTSIQWYATPTGGSPLAVGTTLVNGTTYYASQTTASCESNVRLAVTVTINTPAAPTGSASQSFCNAATVADLTATGSNIQWYAAASGGSPLPAGTSLVNGTSYYASQTISGCESATRLAVTVTIGIPNAPTGAAAQTFCNSATIANLSATGTAIQWYAAASGGTALAAGTALANGSTYYASQTAGGCESTDRLAVTATINAPATPTGSAAQTFCNAATVADLTATGSGIQWYTGATGGTALTTGTALSNGTYYASQTISGCESMNRLAVNVVINAPAAPTGAAAQTICGSGTLADLTVSGSNITWYDAASAGTVLGAGTALADGVTYYATQTISSCESINRLAVTVEVNAIPAAPTGSATQEFCNSATIADLSATGTAINWYPGAASTTPLIPTTAVGNGAMYFATQTVNGCESTDRLQVTVMINAPAAPTGIPNQDFCFSGTVADLEANGQNIQWYNSLVGGGTTPLNPGESLVDGFAYQATQTINGCESQNQFTVTVGITTFSNGVSLNGATLTASATGASYQWIDCNDNNAPISSATSQSFSPAANGNYAVVITVNGCSDTSACVAVTTVGLDDIETEQFRVYPNPASTVVNIEMENTSAVRLFDVSGKLLKELNGASIYTIDVTDLTPGMYIIETAEGAKAKFVKQ